LAGCVLARQFNWRDVLQEDKCIAVRNEVAGGDWVASSARLLHWRFPDFGSAGRRGFKEDAELVHTVQNPNLACTQCGTQADKAPVHNFVSKTKGHSDVLKSTYVKYYWLPFFWGIEP